MKKFKKVMCVFSIFLSTALSAANVYAAIPAAEREAID